MKRSKMFLMSVAVVLFAAGACNKDDDTTTGGETVTPEVSVGEDVTVNAAGGTVTVEYSVTDAVEGASVSATADADWVSASAGDGVVTLTVDANDTGANRSATVTLSYTNAEDVSFTVTQTVPVISVTSSEVSVSAAGEETTVSYSVANAVEEASVSASASETWVSASAGDGVVTVTVAANTTGAERSATVTLSYTYAQDVTVSVVQEANFDASYSDYIGTWTVRDFYYNEFTIWISEYVEDQYYTIDGWQFSEQGYDFNYIGFEEEGYIAFTALYDSSTKSLQLIAYSLGTATDSDDSSVGELYVSGFATINGTNYYITPGSTSYYVAATMTMESSTTATITGETLSTSVGYGDVYRYQYVWEYGNVGYTWSYFDYGYFPCEVTKVSSSTASTSSVKSSEKVAAPVKSETKSAKAL